MLQGGGSPGPKRQEVLRVHRSSWMGAASLPPQSQAVLIVRVVLGVLKPTVAATTAGTTAVRRC